MQVLKPGIYVVDVVEDKATLASPDRVRVYLSPDTYVEVIRVVGGVTVAVSGSSGKMMSVLPHTSNMIHVMARRP